MSLRSMPGIIAIFLLFVLLGSSASAQQREQSLEKKCVEKTWRCNWDNTILQQCEKNAWTNRIICQYGCNNNRCNTAPEEKKRDEALPKKILEEKLLKRIPAIMKNKTEEKPFQRRSIPEKERLIKKVMVCQGCMHDDRCFATGTRLKMNYCGKDHEWHALKLVEFCNAYFECRSGVCKDNQCVEEKGLRLKRPEIPPEKWLFSKEKLNITRREKEPSKEPPEEPEEEIEEAPEINDTEPPGISDRVTIIPPASIPGTMFTIKPVITDNQSAISATAAMSKEGESYTIPLYDDGLHDDGSAGDDKFGGVWDSTGASVGMYDVTITATDEGDNTATRTGSQVALVEEFPCNEVIPDHNNLDESRANVVFVFVNYNQTGDRSSSLEQFSRRIVDEMAVSLLTLEPFASNSDVFNFLYVDSIATVDEYATGWESWAPEANLAIYALAASCAVSNKYIVGFIDWDFRPNANIGGGLAKISSVWEMEEIARITAHEFGHSFGGLIDEYVEGATSEDEQRNNQCFYSPDVMCGDVYNEARGRSYYECGVTTLSVGSCEANANWRDMLGNGCGEDGIIDCAAGDPSYALEETCNNVGCAYAYNLHRHSFNTIMRHHGLDPFSYGPTNQRTMCNTMQEITGSAAGICETLCLEGCPEWQHCVAGACIDV